jgi:hypothetical protein
VIRHNAKLDVSEKTAFREIGHRIAPEELKRPEEAMSR